MSDDGKLSVREKIAAGTATAGASLAVGVVAGPAAGVLSAGIVTPLMERFVGRVGGAMFRRGSRNTKRVASMLDSEQSEGNTGMTFLEEVTKTPAGIDLINAFWADADEEKMWAYAELVRMAVDNGYDLDKRLRVIQLVRRLRNRQLLHLICSIGLRPSGVRPEDCDPLVARFLGENIGRGTASVLAECGLYEGEDGEDEYFNENQLTVDGAEFINRLMARAPLEWPVAPKPLDAATMKRAQDRLRHRRDSKSRKEERKQRELKQLASPGVKFG